VPPLARTLSGTNLDRKVETDSVKHSTHAIGIRVLAEKPHQYRGSSMALCARTRRHEIVVETTSDWALSTPVLVTAVTAK
jgi:hypothetical protein